MLIPFNKPCVVGKEKSYLMQALAARKLSGGGEFNKRCGMWLQQSFGCIRALLTPSCTGALEAAAILSCVKPGDEIIMPSFTFPSAANAFALRGATIVFVDIRPDTMNIDETLIEDAITRRTKLILPMHYAGVSCEMDTVMAIARKHHLLVVEDAAQGVMSTYNGKFLGTIGDLGCYSFHETKNYTCGEGGALLVNDRRFVERAEVVVEKGTNRSKFFRGEIDKYTWVDIGSSYQLSEINAAYLYAQLEAAEKIRKKRLALWDRYYQNLLPLHDRGEIELPVIPPECTHNGHLFYIKLKNAAMRMKVTGHLKEHGIPGIHHYVPLHRSRAGALYGRFHGNDCYTTRDSNRLLRLPLYYELRLQDVDTICRYIHAHFSERMGYYS